MESTIHTWSEQGKNDGESQPSYTPNTEQQGRGNGAAKEVSSGLNKVGAHYKDHTF